MDIRTHLPPLEAGKQSRNGSASNHLEPSSVLADALPFAESPAWQTVGAGWRPLFGSFSALGFSFEWHDFQSDHELNWARSFHPDSIELCLNISGGARLENGGQHLTLGPRTLAFYHQGRPPLAAARFANDRHQFMTVEYRLEFLSQHFGEQAHDLHPLVRNVLEGRSSGSQFAVVPEFGVELLHLVESLRRPPIFGPAQRVWFTSKSLELAAQFFFRPSEGELFCTRTKRAARERVEQAQSILLARRREPPTLEELARQVGCSHFYLSRIFSQEVGMTIQQYLRQIRLERAAELLRVGRCNVTEAAFEVGYNSLSHFSTAFHKEFGCCPGLYSLQPRLQLKTRANKIAAS